VADVATGKGEAELLRGYFGLDTTPRVLPERYYDLAAQLVSGRSGNWASFGVGYYRTFQELARTRACYAPQSRLFGFDWWEGLPEAWRPGFPRGHFRIPRETVVRWYAHDPRVEFVDGLFEETLSPAMLDRLGDLALVHIDCDLYASARCVLTRLPLRSGTVVLFDEFYSPSNEWNWWEHEARAFYEVCTARQLTVTPLCRRAVETGPLSEQAAFLIV
jgi:hypothetical protein